VLTTSPHGRPLTTPPGGIGPISSHRARKRRPCLRVLVVEDNPADALLVREALNPAMGEELELRVVTRAADAERVLSHDPPDIVLLDLGLPDADGIDSLDRVLARAEGVPIVVLTGRDDAGTAALAMKRGAQDYLAKDVLFESDHLVRSIQHSLERHRLLDEARRQERMAQAAERELRRLVEGNVDGMVVIDEAHGRVLFANRAAEALTGAPPGTMVGGAVSLPEGWEHAGQVGLCGGDGKERTVELRTAPIEWQGGPARLLSMRDVTERQAADDLRQRLVHDDRLRSIGLLAAGVAHEVNNPAAFVSVNQEALGQELEQMRRALAVVRDLVQGWGEGPARELERVLEEQGVESILVRSLHILHDNRVGMDRITAIARGLVGFARVDQGRVQEVSVEAVIRDACIMVHNEIRHRATLIKELAPTPSVVVDPGRMVQVLVNLLVNAAQSLDDDAFDRNRIVIRSAYDDGTVRIQVEDTGRGIPEEHLGRIFEPFFTTKEREGGTGLGLALSAEIVRQHGGRMYVYSQVGRGSRFVIDLPEAGNGVSVAPRREEAKQAPAQARRARVLVVDDEAMLLRGIQRILAADHDVMPVEGGASAIEVLRRDRAFDAILCDLMMPEVDGIALHGWIGQHAPELLRRLVFMSGGAFTDRSREFCCRPDVRVVEKPMQVAALRALVVELAEPDPS
jgi:signal transduction histidine kinase